MKTLNLADAEGCRAFAEFDTQTDLLDWVKDKLFTLPMRLLPCVYPVLLETQKHPSEKENSLPNKVIQLKVHLFLTFCLVPQFQTLQF